MSERDELEAIVTRGGGHVKYTASALLAAGFRKPRTITTAEELDALPGESVIRDLGGMVYELDYTIGNTSDKWWIETGSELHIPNSQIELPTTVLHEGTQP